MTTDFTIEKIQQISKDDTFVSEFLKLSYIAFSEAKTTFKTSILNKDVLAYRQMSHKLKTNLQLLGLCNLEKLILEGKSFFEDDSDMTSFSDLLILNIDIVLEQISHLYQQYLNKES